MPCLVSEEGPDLPLQGSRQHQFTDCVNGAVAGGHVGHPGARLREPDGSSLVLHNLNIFTGPGLEFVSVVEPSSVPGARDNMVRQNLFEKRLVLLQMIDQVRVNSVEGSVERGEEGDGLTLVHQLPHACVSDEAEEEAELGTAELQLADYGALAVVHGRHHL